MEKNYIITSFVLVPLMGFLISLLISDKNELTISRISFYTIGIQFFTAFGFIIYWMFTGHSSINIKEISLFQSEEYEFLVDFYFDKVTAVYLLVGAFVTFLIIRYSSFYLHLEQGYKRFFNTILLFFLGYNLTVLSGNFETLFIGWELLGISSFLLIAFYRERYLPVRNAVKVFAIYRIGDVGILLAMWASHHLWHENITFLKLSNYDLVHRLLEGHRDIGIFISVCILVAAAAKSAQFPFSSWLPRAMEGPTPSSAIFYGSLSVHFGVFLLLRTYPFWEHQTSVRVLIGFCGIITAATGFFISRVQSTIKTQIAYASISQIGIMFIEIALGLKTLALIHFAGNAFLRTYQLLVSPSVVSYLIRDQFYHFQPNQSSLEEGLPKRIRLTIYMLSLKEWYLDVLLNKLVFTPIKKIGKRLDFLTYRNVFFYLIPSYITGLLLFYFEVSLPVIIKNNLPGLFSFIGLILVFKSFSERKYPRLAWLLVAMNHLWIALAVSFNEQFDFGHTMLYLSGIIPAALLGWYCLERLKKMENNHFDLNRYYGHSYQYPRLALVFLISALALMGFPITLTFIGEDLIFSHIKQHQYLLAFFNSLSFVLGGISLIRVYARLFLGPHVKTNHPTPLKSS